MPSLRRLFGRGKASDQPSSPHPAPQVNRLVSTLPDGAAALPVDLVPWSVKRLQVIFQQLNQSPNQQAVEDAQAARSCFTRFWLTAPLDFLELLYTGPIGQAYRLMLNGVLPALPLSPADERCKAALTQRLHKAIGHHETTNLLLAVMPYYDHNAMKVADPLRQVPEWLLADYAERCDPKLKAMLLKRAPQANGAAGPAPTALLGPASQPALRPVGSSGNGGGTAQLPLLSQRRGPEGLALIQDNEFLGRMSGLINLYAIDPSDAELKRELAGLRRQVGQIWLDVDTQQLQTLYRAPFGQLSQNLIGSGFSREPLAAEDEAARRQLGAIVGSMQHPRALNALMAALLYYPAGRVNLSAAEGTLPEWLVQELNLLRSRAHS